MDSEILDKVILHFIKNIDYKLISLPQLIENYDQIKDDTIRMHIDKFIDIYNYQSVNGKSLHNPPQRTLNVNGSYYTQAPTLNFYIQNIMAMKYNEFLNIKEGRDPYYYLSWDSDIDSYEEK